MYHHGERRVRMRGANARPTAGFLTVKPRRGRADAGGAQATGAPAGSAALGARLRAGRAECRPRPAGRGPGQAAVRARG